MKSQKYSGLNLKAKFWCCWIQEVQPCALCLHILLSRKSNDYKLGVLSSNVFVAFGSVFKYIECSFVFKDEKWK